MSIQVAIRVRPFNQREIDLKTKLCVQMKGQQTILVDHENGDNTRDFTFDHSFWSHDKFKVTSDGFMVPDSPQSPYADQKKVFDRIGNSILDNAFEGYHCSLFAYGQTGSGKSYSVMGYKPNIGIVPIVCQEIFNRTKDNIPGVTYEVLFGMLEIYNENAQDLLIDIGQRPPSGLSIRQKPGLGFYAQGYISTLADIQSGKKGDVVPYRSSTLTKLLANALGGNSKTIMICAISPAFDNFEESLSTLRYADQAKKIKNTAIVNEDPTEKLIKQLNDDNLKMKQQLEKFEKLFGTNMNESNPNYKKFIKMKENLNENERQISDKNKTQEEKDEEQRNMQVKKKVDQTQPHLWVISEDAQLDGKLLYPLTNPETLVGNQQGVPPPDIKINGIGVRPSHCKFLNSAQNIVLSPIATDYLFLNGEQVTTDQKLFHNDRIIFGTNQTFLIKIPGGNQRDQNFNVTQVNYEFMVKEWQKIKDLKEQARKEEFMKNFQLDSEDRLKKSEEQHKLKVHLLKEEIENRKRQYEKQIDDLRNSKSLHQEGMDLMKVSVFQMLNQRRQQDKLNSTIRKNDNFQKKLQLALMTINNERLRNKLRQLVDETQPKIDRMNIMASDMGRDIKFVLKIKEDDPENLRILVQNKESNTQYHWDLEKAMNRYYVLKEAFNQNIQDGGNTVQKNKNKLGDPFYDEPDAKQIGKCQLSLHPFLYFMDNPSECWLNKHASYDLKGILKVNIFPTNKEGIQNLGRSDCYIDDPKKLIGQTVFVKICIEEAWLLPGVSDIYVEFNFDGKFYRTQEIKGKHLNPYFCYSAIHTYEKFTQENLDYFQNNNLIFRVYGDFNIGNWETHDKGFAGQKEKQLKWLCNPVKEIQDQDINIEIDFNEYQQSQSSSNSLESIKENVLKSIKKPSLKPGTKKKHYSDRFSSFCFDNFEKTRQGGIFFIGLLCFLAFACHAALTGIYRNDYDIFRQNELDKRFTEETENTVEFWVRHSYMLASSLVLASSICVLFVLSGFNVRLKEFLLMTILPFVTWIGSSASWLRADRLFQDQQFSLVLLMKEKTKENMCENAMKNCVMAMTYERLYWLTIYALIIGIPLYLLFVKSVLFHIEYSRFIQYEEKIEKIKNKDQQAESLMGLKQNNDNRVDIENMDVQRINTDRIEVQRGQLVTQGQAL